MLADHQIRALIESGEINITPYSDHQIQPASLDVHLGYHFAAYRYDPLRNNYVDMAHPIEHLFHRSEAQNGDALELGPGAFLLGVTLERVRLPNYLAARFEGRSSLGRLGLSTHITAGFIDPGYDGWITLELKNECDVPLKLYPAMPIGQLAFHRLEQPCERPYGQGATGSKHLPTDNRPVLSQFWRNLRKEMPHE